MAFLSLVLLWACTEVATIEDESVVTYDSGFVSSDLWIDNARIAMDRSLQLNGKSLYAQLPQSGQTLEIVLDVDNEINRVVLMSESSSLEQIFFFEQNRIAFAQSRLAGKSVILSAFADNKAYAHAYSNGTDPESSTIRDLELNGIKISGILSTAITYSTKEKTADYDYRITKSRSDITDTLISKIGYTAIVNVKKDEKIRIDLVSGEPHVYFTLSPNAGSNMEHKFWRGTASFTGDLLIRVFSAEEIRNGAFKLVVERS